MARIPNDQGHLREILDLDHATNDRLLAESGLLPGIGAPEFAAPNDPIDVTNLKAKGATLSFAGDTLAIAHGSLAATITLAGSFDSSWALTQRATPW